MNLTKQITGNITLNAWLKIMALLALLVMLSPRVAHAQVFNVPCDPAALTEAIKAANRTPGHDTILLAAGCTYSLSVPAGSGLHPSGLPSITDALTIEGNDARLERSADAAEEFRLIVASEVPLSITNLTLANGNPGSSNSSYSTGGAILTSGPLSLTNVNVVDNRATQVGGGIAVYGDTNTVLLSNSRFENNQGSRGGGLYAEGSVFATNVSFVNNYGSSSGGGIYALGDTVSIQSSRFEGNSVDEDSFCFGCGFGGGLYAKGDLIIGQTLFINNRAQSGGGLSLSGDPYGGRTFTGQANIAGVRFEGNAAVNGGAIAIYDGSIALAQTIFQGNIADTNGAAVVFLKPRPNSENEVVNNLWVDNHSSGVGYTIYARGTVDTESKLKITHNTLVDSSHNDDAAFFIDQVGETGIWNNIIAYYETGLVSTSEIVYAGYNLYDIEGDSWVGPVEDDSSNLFADPRFLNTATGDYHLRNDSPAIDSGFGPVAALNDLNGISRPQGDGYDLGAYEFVPSSGSITAIDDNYSTPQDTSLTISAPGVLSNDLSVTGDSLTARPESVPSNGTLTFNGDGSFVYTPNNGFSGQDSFTYRATDWVSDSNLATVTITVESVNNAPVANDDAYTTPGDTPLTVAAPGVLGNDSDADGDGLGPVLESGPSNGTLTLNDDGGFTYTPNDGFTGQDSFTYRASDGQANSNAAAVTITVENSNQAPTANDDTYTTSRNTPLVVAAPGVLGNDSDADGDSLTAVLESGPSNGTLTLNANGSFTYTPNHGFGGQDSFTYRATDGQDSSNVATVIINATNGNKDKQEPNPTSPAQEVSPENSEGSNTATDPVPVDQ
jgi:predicted outer membrane repeat protein